MPRELFEDLPGRHKSLGKGDQISRSDHHGNSRRLRNDLQPSRNHVAEFTVGHFLVDDSVADVPLGLVSRRPGRPVLDVEIGEFGLGGGMDLKGIRDYSRIVLGDFRASFGNVFIWPAHHGGMLVFLHVRRGGGCHGGEGSSRSLRDGRRER